MSGKLDSAVCRDLVRKRGLVKRKVTILLNNTESENFSNEINSVVSSLEAHLSSIQEFDDQINDIIYEDLESKDADVSAKISTELDGQTTYFLDISDKISVFKRKLEVKPEVKKENNLCESSDCSMRLPDLKCENFSGEGTSNLQFHTFITQFNNIIGLRKNLSDSKKFTYLRTYLKGYALNIVQHLQVADSSYAVALKLLKDEFLNTNALIEDLIKAQQFFVYFMTNSSPSLACIR